MTMLALGWPAWILAATSPVQTLEARVVGVADGDTVTVLDSNHVQHKIRLAGIDAPEKGQPFGDRSKQSLSHAVMGKSVRVEWSKQDRYGRLVGKIWVSSPDMACARMNAPDCPKNLDVNRAQLSVGLAWHYKEYEKEQSREDRAGYAFEENEARARRAGVWSEPDPVAPWDWRHGTGGGPVKKADASGIYHTSDSPSYSSLKHFKKYATLEECIASGGRALK
jgi:endonuclease YncB( thermonuclease family)